MKLQSALDQIADGCEMSAFAAMLLPVAFPVVALLDSAQDGYLTISMLYGAFALFVGTALAIAMFALSELIQYVGPEAREQRKRDGELYRSYLLNGGKA